MHTVSACRGKWVPWDLLRWSVDECNVAPAQAYKQICKEKCMSDRDIAECILPSTMQLLNGALESEELEGESYHMERNVVWKSATRPDSPPCADWMEVLGAAIAVAPHKVRHRVHTASQRDRRERNRPRVPCRAKRNTVGRLSGLRCTVLGLAFRQQQRGTRSRGRSICVLESAA